MEGPLLVLAGPGSGKTRVVTHRIAHLISEGVPASQIVALSFTNKAADEMRRRVAELVGPQPVEMGTFHRFAARLLRRHAGFVGLTSDYSILDPDDAGAVRTDPLPPGTYTVIVTAVGYQPTASTALVGASGRADLGNVTLARQGGAELPPPGRWTLDPAHSSVGAVAQHLGISSVRGHFTEVSAQLRIAARVEESTVTATIAPRITGSCSASSGPAGRGAAVMARLPAAPVRPGPRVATP